MKLPSLSDLTAHDLIAAIVLFAWIGLLVAVSLLGGGREVPQELRDLGIAAFGWLFRGAAVSAGISPPSVESTGPKLAPAT